MTAVMAHTIGPPAFPGAVATKLHIEEKGGVYWETFSLDYRTTSVLNELVLKYVVRRRVTRFGDVLTITSEIDPAGIPAELPTDTKQLPTPVAQYRDWLIETARA